MRNKPKIFLLIPFLMIVLLLTHTLTVSSQEVAQQRQPVSPSLATTQPIDLPGGVLSNSGEFIAYSVRPKESWINEDIVIQDLEQSTSAIIKLKLAMPFQIVSWSPDDSYLYIFEESHYYGGLRGGVVDVKSKKLIHSFSTLSHNVSWVNNTDLLYFHPEISSERNTNGVSLRRYNVQTNTDTVLLNKSTHNARFPLVKFPTRLDERFEFGIAEDYVDYTSDITEGIEVNLRTGNTRTLSKESLIANSIRRSMPRDLSEIEIISIEEVQGTTQKYKVQARTNINSEETINFTYNSNNPGNYELTY